MPSELPLVRRAPSVLVTGGAGFLGTRVVEGLLALGARVVVADNLSASTPTRAARLAAAGARWRKADVSAAGTFRRLLEGDGPFDLVLHLAARVGVRRVLADPERCRRETRGAAVELVRAVEVLPPHERPRVIAASTSEVYREKAGPLSEGDLVRGTDGTGRWAYAAAKLEAEAVFDTARDAFPVAPLHLRLFNVVGPDQDAASGMVLARFAAQAAAGEALTVHGDGRQVRTFAHVADVAASVVRLCLGEVIATGALNLGGEARVDVATLARLVADEAWRSFARAVEVTTVDPSRVLGAEFDEVRRREPDLSRALGLGLVPSRRSAVVLVAEAVAAAFAGARSVPCGSRAS